PDANRIPPSAKWCFQNGQDVRAFWKRRSGGQGGQEAGQRALVLAGGLARWPRGPRSGGRGGNVAKSPLGLAGWQGGQEALVLEHDAGPACVGRYLAVKHLRSTLPPGHRGRGLAILPGKYD